MTLRDYFGNSLGFEYYLEFQDLIQEEVYSVLMNRQ